MEPSTTPIRKGDEITLNIDALAYGGLGIGRHENMVVFVRQGLPGQTVRVLIYKKRKGYAEARILAVEKESPAHTDPICEHFPTCGGCKHQHLAYPEQLEQKRQQVEDAFQRLAGISPVPIDQVVGADPIFNYRNKMEFTVSSRRWFEKKDVGLTADPFALGLHIPGRFDKILDINTCHIQPEPGNRIIQLIRRTALETGLKPYDPKTHIGFLRHVMLRFGVRTGDIMVNLVTSYENTDLLSPIVQCLTAEMPEITSIINNVNTRKADVAFGEYEIVLHGSPVIREKIGPLTFEISANSFFQTNTRQGEVLYNIALEKAALTGQETVWDLFCGTGSISLFLAEQAKEVYGFDIIQSAIEDALRNAIANDVKNTYFVRANLDHHLKGTNRHQYPPPDVIVLDPPRAGLHEDLVKLIPKLAPKRIVYISCNPATQARDVALLQKRSYRLREISVVDMFPHTPHIETVAQLEPLR
ncbi:MAG: 23S rRNA (uracil(1939)-C(5))-methyltransferase RlmD [Fidelibacterota bacterium]